MTTKNDFIAKAQTVCGAAHQITGKVLDIKGHLLKYTGTIDFKNEHLVCDCPLDDGTVPAEWNPDGRLIGINGGLPFGNMDKAYRLVVIEKI